MRSIGLFGIAALAVAACSSGGTMTGPGDLTGGAQDLSGGASEDLAGGGSDGGMNPGEILLTNNPSGKDCDDVVGPAMGEEKHLAAARLTPTKFPFVVTSLRYAIGEGFWAEPACNATLAHRVDLYVASGVAPAATPTVAQNLAVPAATKGADKRRVIDLKLTSPITIPDGSHLFVALQYAGTFPKVLCQMGCTTAPTADRNYWSNAEKPLYAWATPTSLDIDVNLDVQAIGHSA
ncbi:MAG: hypothetical protein EXR72_07690 [Myxococcales bacterium]|nr:hypothetical protein [Myxococcales bacterium]